MPQVHRFAEFVSELQQLEKVSIAAQGPQILEAFARHTRFDKGVLYLRDGRGPALRLAAATGSFGPDILDGDLRAEDAVLPSPAVVVPLQSHREAIGVLALSTDAIDDTMDDDVTFVRAGAAFLSTIIANQRLMQDAREGDFQLKYRLWELESLYDIGLSIASTLNVDELADEILFRMISLTNARRAALYLREFLGDKVTSWAHFDMSAPSWADKTGGELQKGATGWGVRTLVRYLSA